VQVVPQTQPELVVQTLCLARLHRQVVVVVETDLVVVAHSQTLTAATADQAVVAEEPEELAEPVTLLLLLQVKEATVVTQVVEKLAAVEVERPQ
jgi:hypothetical protein